jgi:hypothetical protein
MLEKTNDHAVIPRRSFTVDSNHSTLQADSTTEPPSERRPKSRRSKSRDEMDEAAHGELHSTHGDVVRDVIIGFADGLTVPFALTAGLSS